MPLISLEMYGERRMFLGVKSPSQRAYAAWTTPIFVETSDQEKTISDTGENLKDLNFEYDISGHKKIKPLRAYNNGIKTIIQMPKLMTATEAPILLVLDESNNEQLVNYRLHQDRYIVDQLFQKAVLVSGVGSSQKKATITRR